MRNESQIQAVVKSMKSIRQPRRASSSIADAAPRRRRSSAAVISQYIQDLARTPGSAV